MSFLSDVKLVAQILGLVILIITLILTLCRLLTNNTVTNAQIFPGGNLAGSDGITRGSQDIIQMIAVNLNPIWPSQDNTYYVGASNINKLEQSVHWSVFVGLFELRGVYQYIVWGVRFAIYYIYFVSFEYLI